MTDREKLAEELIASLSCASDERDEAERLYDYKDRILSALRSRPDQMGEEMVDAKAREIARQVVASRRMQRTNGVVYAAALEAARAALSSITSPGREVGW